MMRARGPHPLPLFLAAVGAVCGADQARLARVLAGLARYQAAPLLPPRPVMPEIARIGGVALRAHRPSGEPLIMVPSLINPPDVLDFAPGNSLLGHLADAGFRPLMVDWGDTPEPLGLSELVAQRLVPLIAALGRPVPALGYCLGGTLALAAARAGGISRLALLAAPWRFAAYGDDGRQQLGAWWQNARLVAEPLGLVPMDLLQPAFWALDPEALAAKFDRLADADDAEVAAFAQLEDWANSGAPLSLAAAAELAALAGSAATGLGGAALPPIALLDVVAGGDRIVPAGAALSMAGEPGPHPAARLDVARLDVASGHVGMIVGRQAPALLWKKLSAWLKVPAQLQ